MKANNKNILEGSPMLLEEFLNFAISISADLDFGLLINQLLMESEGQLDSWKNKILEVVRSNGKVLTEVISHLEKIIGLQPEVPELGGQEAQYRISFAKGH